MTLDSVHSLPRNDPWNQAQEPKDWWGKIRELHGHVGPWNVLGYRIGKAILREMNARWGQHSLAITCHIPLDTPYSCLVDGVAVGTGNSQGRLDLGIGEVATLEFLHVSAREKEGRKRIVIKPSQAYLEKIETRPVDELETLARECGKLREQELFQIMVEADDPERLLPAESDTQSREGVF